jgi:hypothetical protein
LLLAPPFSDNAKAVSEEELVAVLLLSNMGGVL